jgi:hypothetical protein
MCPCAAFKEILEENIRLKAQSAEYKHMLFGQASEKMTVLGRPGLPRSRVCRAGTVAGGLILTGREPIILFSDV